jgi:hypothetical protein
MPLTAAAIPLALVGISLGMSSAEADIHCRSRSTTVKMSRAMDPSADTIILTSSENAK